MLIISLIAYPGFKDTSLFYLFNKQSFCLMSLRLSVSPSLRLSVSPSLRLFVSSSLRLSVSSPLLPFSPSPFLPFSLSPLHPISPLPKTANSFVNHYAVRPSKQIFPNPLSFPAFFLLLTDHLSVTLPSLL